MSELKQLDPKELIDSGLLQEVNRRFFHPLGLALFAKSDGGELKGIGILDNRKDKDGYCYSDEYMDSMECLEKAINVDSMVSENREENMGYIIQPLKGLLE